MTDFPDSAAPSLDDLRAQVDEIDDAVHDLLMRRAELVLDIGVAKGPGPVVRPGREAALIRRIVDRHEGPLPARVLIDVWRHLIAGYSAIQGDFGVAVFAPEGDVRFLDLARAHYGTYVQIAPVGSLSQVIKAVTDGAAAVGVLPVPREDDADIWWRNIVSTAETTPRIVARLPFTGVPKRANLNEQTEAVAIACAPAEPSGADASYIVFETDAGVSRGRLVDMMNAHGLEPSFFAAWSPPGDREMALTLIEVDGFVGPGDDRVAKLLLHQPQTFRHAVPIGAYARPFDSEALEGH